MTKVPIPKVHKNGNINTIMGKNVKTNVEKAICGY
jgi:hypothetical protein